MTKYERKELIDLGAAICHEANRAYCQSIGDHSQPTWDEAPAIIKKSVKSGVRAILDNPGLTPAQSHKAWVDYKLAEGWKYGPVKNVETKEHPNLRPYGALSDDERYKDVIFGCVVRALISLVDQKLEEKLT